MCLKFFAGCDYIAFLKGSTFPVAFFDDLGRVGFPSIFAHTISKMRMIWELLKQAARLPFTLVMTIAPSFMPLSPVRALTSSTLVGGFFPVTFTTPSSIRCTSSTIGSVTESVFSVIILSQATLMDKSRMSLLLPPCPW